MELAVKQRLIGAAVLAALAMIFLPMLLQNSDVQDSDVGQVLLTMPAAPDQAFETRELSLPVPAASTGSAVLSPASAPDVAQSADPNAVVTVDANEPPAVAVDAATGQPATEPAMPQSLAVVPVTPANMPPSATQPSTPTPTAQSVQAAPAVVPPPKPAAALPATAAAGDFAVNVGSFSNVANARLLENKLRAAGLPVRSEQVAVAGKPAQRLRIGPYAERAAAEAARLRAQALTGSAGQVIALDASTPVTASTPATAASKPALTVGFAVQLGALRDEADAIALRDRARAAGFVAFHQRVNSDNGVLFRVRVGPEADRSAAESLRIALAAKLGVSGVVVSHP